MHPIQVNTEVHDIPFHDSFETYLSLREHLGEQNTYFLETLSGSSKSAQSTFIGFKPLFTITAFSTEIQLTGLESLMERVSQGGLKAGLLVSRDGGLHLRNRKDLWDFLRFVQSQFTVSVPDRGEAFYFGFFGYLGYDTAWSVESLPSQIPNDGTVPDLALSLYQGLIEYNLVDKTVRLILNQAAEGWDDLSKAEICLMLHKGDLQMNRVLTDAVEPLSVEYTIDSQVYQNNVRKALSYISAGDIYQVQLGNQINIDSPMTPVDVYRRLRVRNPSPYMYLATFGGMTLIGASPELYIKIQGGNIIMRPIAGTCPKGSTPEENTRLIEALKRDEKEVAEHIMLVDLCRNDIGRVCETGTLEVEELMAIEKYSHLNHLVSSVRGAQKATNDMYDIIAATFPAGTMTGAPKIRAMEIIEELETTRRGAYAGAMGFIDFNGYVNMALCIRTAVHHKPDSYSIRASAGVVADSVPEKEWSETFHKMGALFWAVTGREVLHESIGR